jgi:hypothetical protein
MIARPAACLLFGLASLAAGQSATEQALPHIAAPETLATEMAKALVSGDRDRFTALAATRKEMEELLAAAQPPSTAEDRQYQKDKVTEILDDRRDDFERFQAMKKSAGVIEGAAVRFEIIVLDPIYVKDGMKKVRHSRIRMFQAAPGGQTEAFLIGLDDMFLFPRGWAFTSVAPGIARETSRNP